MGPEQFWVSRVLGAKNYWAPNKFGSQIIMGPEIFWVLKNFEAKLPENLGVPKFVGPKEFRDPKKFWSKILGSEKFWV